MHVLPDWVAVTTETLTHNVPVTMEKIRSSERYNHEHSMMEKCGYTLKYSWTHIFELAVLPLTHIFKFATGGSYFWVCPEFASLQVDSPFWFCQSLGSLTFLSFPVFWLTTFLSLPVCRWTPLFEFASLQVHSPFWVFRSSGGLTFFSLSVCRWTHLY